MGIRTRYANRLHAESIIPDLLEQKWKRRKCEVEEKNM